jgi:hypothetical protein
MRIVNSFILLIPVDSIFEHIYVCVCVCVCDIWGFISTPLQAAARSLRHNALACHHPANCISHIPPVSCSQTSNVNESVDEFQDSY